MKERFETFTMLINRISRNIRKIKKQEMAEYDLKSAHISCLYYLYSFDGLTATDLCEKCEEDKATISRSLDYLEKRGFLTYETKNIKRYRSPINLTDFGTTVAQKIADKIDCALQQVGMGLSEEERVSFYKSLFIISKNLERISNGLN